jgi:hypothetical protein
MPQQRVCVPQKVSKHDLYKELIAKGVEDGCLTKKEIRETVVQCQKVKPGC